MGFDDRSSDLGANRVQIAHGSGAAAHNYVRQAALSGLSQPRAFGLTQPRAARVARAPPVAGSRQHVGAVQTSRPPGSPVFYLICHFRHSFHIKLSGPRQTKVTCCLDPANEETLVVWTAPGRSDLLSEARQIFGARHRLSSARPQLGRLQTHSVKEVTDVTVEVELRPFCRSTCREPASQSVTCPPTRSFAADSLR